MLGSAHESTHKAESMMTKARWIGWKCIHDSSRILEKIQIYEKILHRFTIFRYVNIENYT